MFHKSRLISEDSGQGITEYGSVLAFLALLIAVVIAVSQGSLALAVQQCFSSVSGQVAGVAEQSQM